MVWTISLLVAGTTGLFLLSRKSLHNPGSHGFFRFLAWETILLLFLYNIKYWFVNPFSWNQLISWIFLTTSIVPLVWGVILLKKWGKSTSSARIDPSLYSFERTNDLVTSGIFRYIRHPLYSSLLLLSWGIFFKHLSLPGIGMAWTASGFLYLTALADEDECLDYFGSKYQDYMVRTKRFIPFIF